MRGVCDTNACVAAASIAIRASILDMLPARLVEGGVENFKQLVRAEGIMRRKPLHQIPDDIGSVALLIHRWLTVQPPTQN